MQPTAIPLLVLAAAVITGLFSASGEGTPGARVRLSQLEEAELVQAAGAVVLVQSEVRIGSAGDVRSIEDAGTGVLVTPCHVLTARHVLGQAKSSLAPVTRRFTVSVAKPGEAAFVERPATLAVEGGVRGTRRSALLDDWALLELETPVTDVAPLQTMAGTCCARQKDRIAIAGFPLDLFDPEAPEIWIDKDCRILEKLANRIVATDCAATSGNSGGPLLAETDSGWRLAAILTRAPAPGGGGLSSGQEKFAIPVDNFLKRRIASMQASCARQISAST